MPMRAAHGAQRALVARQQRALELDVAAVERFEPVGAAEQRRLAGARRADQAHDLARVHVEVDAAERVNAP